MIVKKDVKPQLIDLVPSGNAFNLGQSSHWFSRPSDVILRKRLWETLFRIKRDAYFLYLTHLELSSATSFDLDRSKYCCFGMK